MDEKNFFCRRVLDLELDVGNLDLPRDLIGRVYNGYGHFAACLEWYRGSSVPCWGENSFFNINNGRRNLLFGKEKELLSHLEGSILKDGVSLVSVEEYTEFYDLWQKLGEYNELLRQTFEAGGFIREDFIYGRSTLALRLFTEDEAEGLFDVWHKAGRFHDIYETVVVDELDPLRLVEKFKHKLPPLQYGTLRAYLEGKWNLEDLSSREQELFKLAKRSFMKLLANL